ncbi:General stress protein 16U [Candidatus Magnetaquicoccaceae bacterium FCR-1]|uniref:General stress protein 16U n=1 Tax=Candidatus Magnetaquiglobus chichijimensis TaxID=3141448 RepID=A0ABQ0C499_9PROT
MPVSLTKGGNVSLSKEAPGMKAAMIGLGWDVRSTDGQPFDLDGVVFILGANGKVRSDADFVFYNNAQGAGGAVQHQGDNRTGAGEGDDERILMNLAGIPADVDKVVIAATIHEGESRRQNFGQVNNAYMRVINAEGGAEIARYDLSEDASTEAAMIFGEIYKRNGEWKFRAVGQGYAGGLGPLARSFGVDVG